MSSVLGNKLFKNSIFRLSLIYMTIFSLSVILIFSFMYWATAGYMMRQTEATIETESSALVDLFQHSDLSVFLKLINDRVFESTSTYNLYLLTDSNYKPLAGNLKTWPEGVITDSGWLAFDFSKNGLQAGGAHQGLAQSISLKNGYHLLVGQDIHELQKIRQLVWDAILGGVIMTLVLAFIGGLMMSKTMMHRIEEINETCHRIMDGDLSRRIPGHGGNDDFDKLIQTLNRMLDRIEQLMHGIKQVSDNIAHDLRTPLSRLRRRLDLLRIEQDDAELRGELLDQTINEADGLLSTFKALLRISDVESGSRRANFQEVDLTALVGDLVELYEPLAQDKGQLIRWNKQKVPTLHGDRDLLFQAFSNVLDNAIKYTPDQGHIELCIDNQPEGIGLTISDSGPGIPADERKKVLERFYRLELNRSSPGNGLGLSLVAAIVKFHQGQLSLGDNNPGLKVTILLPARWAFCTMGKSK